MKITLIILSLFVFALMNCTKSIANEEEEMVDENFHKQAVGSAARNLLSADKYRALVIEVQYMPGFEPDKKALENLKTFLYKHINKPGGIAITTKEIPAAKDSVLSIAALKKLEEVNRMEHNRSNELAIYIIYTNGYYVDQQMLGYAYQSTSAVLFGKNIHDNSNGYKKPSRTKLETRVLQHELGHLLGLVNVGTDLQSNHKDDAHGKHCTNKECLMYYLTDTEENPSFLIKKGVPKLDKECIDDLRANGGRR